VSGFSSPGSTEQFSGTTAQFDKTTSTAMANITGLSAALTSGVKYAFDLVLQLSLDATGGYRFDMDGGSATGSNINITYSGAIFAAGNPLIGETTALATDFTGAGPTFVDFHIHGEITCNGSGTLIPRFAQNAANGTSSIRIGATMSVKPIG
jgi:hypothetical protein